MVLYHFLSCILKDYNRWVFNETLEELLMVNRKLVLRLLVLQSLPSCQCKIGVELNQNFH